MTRRIAAALLLTRGTGGDLEVFLVERAPELRFFGGYHALPGGTLAPGDGAGSGGDGTGSVGSSGGGGGDEAAALQRCAHRELFEETGLLRVRLPAGRTEPAALAAVRRAMLDAERQGGDDVPPFRALVGSEPLPALRPLCRIETPPFAPVRYDTVFVHCALEDCATGTRPGAPDVWPGELTSGRFWRPDEALAAWRAGSLLLVPPVVILLEHLAAATGPGGFETFAAAIATTAAGYRAGRLHQVRFSPGVVLAPLRTPTLPPATTTNCYVVGRDELWVVDPGSPEPREQERLLALLDELCAPSQGGTRPRLAGVLATHHHVDHVGGIAPLCAARQLTVRGHERTLRRLPPGCPPGEPLRDGDSIALGAAPDGTPGWRLLAVHTPGHDQGHLCFEESRYGAMLVGDMVSTMSTIIVDPPEGHLASYLQSLDTLAARPLTTLYPAHGPALRDGGRLVRQYQRHRRQRETTLLQALAQGPATAEALLPKVYWDADPSLYRYAARSLLAGLQKLQEEGRALQDDATWRLVTP